MSTVRRPCRQCNRGPKDTAMAVTTDERGTVIYCHRCGYTEVDNRIIGPSAPAQTKSYRPWLDLAEHLWAGAHPLVGSLAATYLQRRGCVLPPADGDLRFLPVRGNYPAAMLARVTDIVTGEPISLHFTKLNPDGIKHADGKRLLSGHRKVCGCIRLWPDDCVTRALALAEGIETALSVAHAFTPVWATVDAGNLKDFPVLPGIETLTVFADNDDAGIKAAEVCTQRWDDAGRETYITTPLRAGADINDLVAA